MKKLYDAFSLKNLNFGKKMLLIYVVCVIIPFAVLSIFYYFITINKIEKQNIVDLNYSIEKTGNSLDNIIDNVIMISDMIYSNGDIYNLLSSDGSENMIIVADKLDEKITSFAANNIIGNISIYTANDALYRSASIKKNFSENEEWMRLFKDSGNKVMPLAYYSNENNAYVLSLVRELRKNIRSGKYDILKIDITPSIVHLSLDSASENYGLYLLNDENEVLYSTRKESNRYKTGEEIDIQANNIYLYDLDFPVGYKVAGEYSFDVGESIFNHETALFVLIVIVLFGIATAMILVIKNSFVQTLTNLTESTKKIKEEKFELIDTSKIGSDEIGMLTLGMNSAIVKINELINNVYKEKLRNAEIEKEKRIAEFNALQSQINPHFMFNLFEVIRMKSRKRGDKETANVMKDISLMFRNLIKWGEDLITFEKELIFINAYLNAQRYNMDDEAEIRLDIDDETKNCIIPKMSVHVFVENAFVHGLDSIYDNRKFLLSASIKNDKLIIKISDNGEGISQEIIESICEKDTGKLKEASNGIGLENVISRLNLYFDDDYNISVVSIPYEKTEIVLELPVRQN